MNSMSLLYEDGTINTDDKFDKIEVHTVKPADLMDKIRYLYKLYGQAKIAGNEAVIVQKKALSEIATNEDFSFYNEGIYRSCFVPPYGHAETETQVYPFDVYIDIVRICPNKFKRAAGEYTFEIGDNWESVKDAYIKEVENMRDGKTVKSLEHASTKLCNDLAAVNVDCDPYTYCDDRNPYDIHIKRVAYEMTGDNQGLHLEYYLTELCSCKNGFEADLLTGGIIGIIWNRVMLLYVTERISPACMFMYMSANEYELSEFRPTVDDAWGGIDFSYMFTGAAAWHTIDLSVMNDSVRGNRTLAGGMFSESKIYGNIVFPDDMLVESISGMFDDCTVDKIYAGGMHWNSNAMMFPEYHLYDSVHADTIDLSGLYGHNYLASDAIICSIPTSTVRKIIVHDNNVLSAFNSMSSKLGARAISTEIEVRNRDNVTPRFLCSLCFGELVLTDDGSYVCSACKKRYEFSRFYMFDK